MTVKKDKLASQVTPKKDGRWRSSRSESLWVLSRSFESDKLVIVGIVQSVERTVYRIAGKFGEWVRYDNRYFPLHPAEKFSEIVEGAGANDFEFFNNEQLYNNDASENQIQNAPFIYLDEPGGFASF